MFHDAPGDDSERSGVHLDLERALMYLPEEFKTPLLLAEVEGLARLYGARADTTR